jgi:hypothetical protein
MRCLCCGQWRIEVLNVDGHGRYKVLHSSHLISHTYLRTPAQVAELITRYGGPDLANFEECS